MSVSGAWPTQPHPQRLRRASRHARADATTCPGAPTRAPVSIVSRNRRRVRRRRHRRGACSGRDEKPRGTAGAHDPPRATGRVVPRRLRALGAVADAPSAPPTDGTAPSGGGRGKSTRPRAAPVDPGLGRAPQSPAQQERRAARRGLSRPTGPKGPTVMPDSGSLPSTGVPGNDHPLR